ncbi:MAG: cyclic nucleotide-binding domain-containing protein [Verrucomicrobiae bacterium]|nr:cyclic nucleotide-binding domain-containing protein [Verrucomicrobiae bacterium]
MDWLHKLLEATPRREVAPGAAVIEQGQTGAPLLVLLRGNVEVLRDEVCVARTSDVGAIFGEMSALLGTPCTATVRTLSPATFAVVEDPEAFLQAAPEVALHVARLLARRLDSLNRYLVDVKAQYEGHDHLGMVDDVLDSLMHRHPRSGPR